MNLPAQNRLAACNIHLHDGTFRQIIFISLAHLQRVLQLNVLQLRRAPWSIYLCHPVVGKPVSQNPETSCKCYGTCNALKVIL